MRQPAERPEQVRSQHQRHDQKAVADIDQVHRLRAPPQRQLRGLVDGSWALDVAAHAPGSTYSFDARGLTAVKTTRCSRLPRRTNAAATSAMPIDRKSTRLNSSHGYISYAVFCLKKKKNKTKRDSSTRNDE